MRVKSHLGIHQRARHGLAHKPLLRVALLQDRGHGVLADQLWVDSVCRKIQVVLLRKQKADRQSKAPDAGCFPTSNPWDCGARAAHQTQGDVSLFDTHSQSQL